MARDFNFSTPDYLDVAPEVLSSEPFSMGCWFWTTGETSNMTLMSTSQSTGLGAWRLHIAGGDSSLRASKTNDSGSNASASSGASAVLDSTWHHGLAVFTGDADRDVYIDGSGTNDTTSRADPLVSRTALGVWLEAATTNQPYDGLLAEAAMWSVALSADDAAALAVGGSPLFVRPDVLVA